MSDMQAKQLSLYHRNLYSFLRFLIKPSLVPQLLASMVIYGLIHRPEGLHQKERYDAVRSFFLLIFRPIMPVMKRELSFCSAYQKL